jgi:dihydroorotase
MRLTLPKPFDGHAHLRDGAMLKAVLPYTVRQFGSAIVMPNLKTPVTTTARAKAYRDEIRAALPLGAAFEPLMTLYLTDTTNSDDLEQGFKEGVLTAAKLYPANATTGSAFGVSDIQVLAKVLECMQRIGMPLSVHGEVTDPDVDIFDREAVFLNKILIPLRRHFPALRIVFEHLTCAESVDYVLTEGQDGLIAGTITAHHLRLNRSDLFKGGLRPHLYNNPIPKKESDRKALITAATSGGRMFFLGTDSAPHSRTAKEGAVIASGCFTHVNALELCAQVFQDDGALDRLEAFASLNGPAFYGFPVAKDMLGLEKLEKPLSALKPILTSDGAEIVPFNDGAPLFWRLTD